MNVDQDFSDHLAPRLYLEALASPSKLQAPQTAMATTPLPPPTQEDIEELLLIARYGELDELKSFIEKFGTKPLTDARDEDGNTILHMVCGNGHLGATDSNSKR